MTGAGKNLNRMLVTATMLLVGAVLGIVSKLLDIHTQNLGKIISFGILLVTLTVSVVVFDGPRVYDIVIMLILAYFLFIHRVNR